MNFRDRLGMFVLTKQEQRTIAFIVLMLVLGLATKHYRATHPPTPLPNEQVRPAGSPTATRASG